MKPTRTYLITKQETRFGITFKVRSKNAQLNNTEHAYVTFTGNVTKAEIAEHLKSRLMATATHLNS